MKILVETTEAGVKSVKCGNEEAILAMYVAKIVTALKSVSQRYAEKGLSTNEIENLSGKNLDEFLDYLSRFDGIKAGKNECRIHVGWYDPYSPENCSEMFISLTIHDSEDCKCE